MIAALKALLEAALADKATVYDLDTGPLPADGPAVWITAGPLAATNRTVAGRSRGYADAARMVCVSNSAAGVRKLARDVVATLDGQHPEGLGVIWCPRTSEPIEDRKDPTEYRWSATVDAETMTPRGAL